MLKSAKPVCFVASAKPAVAKKFYQRTLGLPLLEDTPFAIVFDSHGTTLRVQKVQHVAPAGYTALGWEVADIYRAVKQFAKKGIRFERFDGMPQDELGIWAAPGGSLVAWFKDPDGNILSLTQFPSHPKRADRSRNMRRTKGRR